MFNKSIKFVPSLFIQNKGEFSTKVALSLTQVERKKIIRFTGGCGYMSEKDSNGLYNLFIEALTGFKGAVLFGGTRMLKKNNKKSIVPGITEIPPLLRKNNPDLIILGVIPKTKDLVLDECGLIVSNESENDYLTIVNPDQDLCLVVQESVDKYATWETEFEECIDITSNLRNFANWDSLLISYNGGSVTEKEIITTVKLEWPVLLIKGSGRATDKIAENNFIKKYPNVYLAEKDSDSIRNCLIDLDILEKERSKTIQKLYRR
jgi:hypothetical protein